MEHLKRLYVSVFQTLVRLVREKTFLIIPFIVLAVCNFCALILIYLGPRYPLSKFFAPPVRKIWGDQFLHYPQNFSLLPKLYNYAHTFISFTIGLCVTAILIILIAHVLENKKKKKLKISTVFVRFATKYVPMLIFFAVFYGFNKMLFSLMGKMLLALLADSDVLVYCHLVGNFLLSLILQMLFAFVFPAILLSGGGLFSAIKENFSLVFKNMKEVFIIVLIPSLLYLLVIINMLLMPQLMARFEPEIMLGSLSFNIIMTVMIDFLITGATTILYLVLCGRVQCANGPETVLTKDTQ